MGLSITGYVLEPVRVGQSNSPFTLSPDNFISDQSAFDTAYPTDESEPRTEYLVQVLEDTSTSPTGPGGNSSLPDATFLWTKNEGAIIGTELPFLRFDYSGQDQRFKLLPGGPREVLDVLAVEPGGSNTNPLAVSLAPLIDDLASFPARISVTDGTTFTIDLVATDVDLAAATPGLGEVALSQESGSLKWNVADLTTYAGQNVIYQRQAYFSFNESSGNIGNAGDTLYLTPIPDSGQTPLLRFGFNPYLTAIEVVSFGTPVAGTVEWHRDTGELRFNAADLVTNDGFPVYYDGSHLGLLTVPTTNRGDIGSPTSVPTPVDEDKDLYFRIPNVVQFPITKYVDSFSTSGKKGTVEVNRSTGAVEFSASDQTTYSGNDVYSVDPDLVVERGVTLRLFRTPVDPGATDDSAKDVKAIYSKIGLDEAATLADPIIGSPSVLLPVAPLDNANLLVHVTQGTGSFVSSGSGLPRLDASPAPGAGVGYVLDFEERQLVYGERFVEQVFSATGDYASLQLPSFPVLNSNLLIELEDSPGSGTYTPAVQGEDYLIDLNSGVITYTSTEGTLEASGSTASIAGSVLTDTSQAFSLTGTNYLVVLSGGSEGVYEIAGSTATTLTADLPFPSAPESNVSYEVRSGKEILADRFFSPVNLVDPDTRVERLTVLGVASNGPRLNIPKEQIGTSRFRFEKTTFATVVTVANDGAFTSPAAGTIEISSDTGNLNFSASDLGLTVYWAKEQQNGTDYTIQSGLGFIDFTDRMLEGEEVYLTYYHLDDVLPDGTIVKTLVEERGAFAVTKELTEDHPTPVSTLSFNPLGREGATLPTPIAYRGGRPQSSAQVSFDIAASTVTFLADDIVTDALPHGPIVDPIENVYIDYWIHEAIGGEKNISVLQPPMALAQAIFEEGATSFELDGDFTGTFKAGALLKVDGAEVYLLGTVTFSGGKTTVTLDQTSPQVFKSDLNNPALEITSGALPLTTYFVTEGTPAYNPIPGGSTDFKVTGDVSRTYTGGTVVLFTDNSTFQDYNLVEGSEFDADTGLTKVTLLGNVSAQYTDPPVILRRSVRTILPTSVGEANTANPPVLSNGVLVFRRVEGEVGEVLTQDEDYTIDDAGRVVFTEGLTFDEELSIFYTGVSFVQSGIATRATWNAALIPSASNGLLNQKLKMEYDTYIPDTFFYHVENMTNFRGQLAEEFIENAAANAPSGGPILENSSGTPLYEAGAPGLFYDERHLANVDLIAVPTLKFFNDAVNYLEDYLQQADGRVVGDRDGRFLFDGVLTNPVRADFASATNQIDDLVTVFGSISIPAYTQSAFSRIFPSSRRSIGTVDPTGLSTGDPIYETGYSPMTSVTLVQRRFPFAVITAAAVTGDTVLTVDDSNGDPLFFRPAFPDNSEVITIIDQDGSVLDNTGLTVSSKTATSITLSGGVAADIPAGSTIRLADADTVYRQTYILGVDLKTSLDDGLVLFVESGDVPNPPFTAKTINVDEEWDVVLGATPTSTEAFRFPALDGEISDDDGDIQTNPVLTPQAGSELATNPKDGTPNGTGLLARTATLNTQIQVETVDPFIASGASATGSLVGTTLTLSSGTFPTTPRCSDLVLITTGTNASPLEYVKVLSATGTTITLNGGSFPYSDDTGFDFLVTVVATPLVSAGPAAGISVTGTTFTDTTGTDFVAAGVLPGMTVAVVDGANDLQRRQVASITSTSVLELESAFGSDTSNFTYRIDNCISTNGLSNSTVAQWLAVQDEMEDRLLTDSDSETNSLENYVDTVGLDIIVSTTGTTSGTNLNDTTEDLSVVTTQDLVFIRSGSNQGVYGIVSVDDADNITVDTAFPVSTGGQSYRILRGTATSKDSLETILDTLANIDSEVTNVQTAQALGDPVTVASGGSIHATTMLHSSLDTRDTEATARATTLDTDIANISAIMSSDDRLYDQRFVWIDQRTNQETGIQVRIVRAIEKREKALNDLIKDLLKLLTV